MFLKRLSCNGFKSFADKTDFDFLRGVTCIVGPNGCGKSNVVDAIKWCLGEQSARSLRGRQMMDVIFNGSGTRRSSGMAQVDLVFDNADRALQADYDEVTISRRLYRSGESEYLINGQIARLKDVRELFLDTGVGLDAYSIIEQGKVALLIEANPAERRLIFEEAAGISRYKARKKEAIRKLERVDQNLLRLNDIIEEVDKRLRSVKYQAGKARNYQTYAARLRELRASFSLAEYHRLTQTDRELLVKITEASDHSTALRTEIDRAEAASAEHDTVTLRLDGEIRDLEHQLLNVTAEITSLQERIRQSRQRMEEQEQARDQAQARLFGEQRRAVTAAAEIETQQAAADEIDAQIRAQRETVDALHAQDQEVSRELTALTAQLEDEKAGIIELVRRSAQLHNDINSLKIHRDNLGEQKSRLAARGVAISEELAGFVSRKAEFDARLTEIRELLATESQRLEEKKREAHQLDAARAQLEQELAESKEDRSGLLSRKSTLADLDRRLEGVEAGVRKILQGKNADPSGQAFACVRGMVADLVSTDVEHAAIVELALGDVEQHLVVTDHAAFLAEAAAGPLAGRVHAICLDRLGPIINDRSYAEDPGFVANIIDLVKYPPELEQLVRHLVGRTVLVQSIEDALRLAEHAPSGQRFLTADGRMVEPGGRLSLGPIASHAGLISRKSELREVDQQIATVEDRIAILTDRRSRMSSDIEHLNRTQQELRQAIYEARTAEVQTNAARNTTEEAIGRLTREQPLVAGEVASLERQMAASIEKARASEMSLEEIQRQNTDREAHVQRLADRIGLLSQQRSGVAEKLTAARVEAGKLDEKRAAFANSMRSLREAHRTAVEAVTAARNETENCRGRIEHLERDVLRAGSRLSELFGEKEVRSRDVLTRRREREQRRVEMEQLSATVRKCRGELEEVEKRLHDVQMEQHDAQIRRDSLLTRVRDELGIDLAEQYASYEHTEQDWQAVETEIAELRQRIERLGNVNLDAIAEQDELEKRSEFLTTQRDDLTASKKQLEELIERLNAESRERFQKTFDDVRIHFQDLFRKLFGGGKADVFLEKAEDGVEPDILEAGIEIIARPPGKEPKSISLLSGGEKTMTCIALLMAIFKARPSPFAILDEVDAALDESNNERFNRIVREFLDHSQFMIITHSKRTMSIADVMYGVTMQEAGVSKRVSVKFEDDSRDDETAVA